MNRPRARRTIGQRDKGTTEEGGAEEPHACTEQPKRGSSSVGTERACGDSMRHPGRVVHLQRGERGTSPQGTGCRSSNCERRDFLCKGLTADGKYYSYVFGGAYGS